MIDRKKTKKPFVLILTILILSLAACAKTEKIPISFFYMELCPGCDSYQKAEYLSGLVYTLGKTKIYEGQRWNMGHGDQEGNKALFETMEQLGIPDISYALPLLFVGSEYYVGYEDIERKLLDMLDSAEK